MAVRCLGTHQTAGTSPSTVLTWLRSLGTRFRQAVLRRSRLLPVGVDARHAALWRDQLRQQLHRLPGPATRVWMPTPASFAVSVTTLPVV